MKQRCTKAASGKAQSDSTALFRWERSVANTRGKQVFTFCHDRSELLLCVLPTAIAIRYFYLRDGMHLPDACSMNANLSDMLKVVHQPSAESDLRGFVDY